MYHFGDSPMMLRILIILFLFGRSMHAQDSVPSRWSASYEILEMSVNNFRYFAGDVAYTLSEHQQLRFVVMEVALSERHLADDVWSKIAEGPNLTGYMRGYEITLDHFVTKRFYVMLNAAFIHLDFEHMVTKQQYRNDTFSLGTGFGYKWNLPILNERIFINPSIPIRYFFNPVEETIMGTSKINAITLAPSVWLFIGYEL